jgi:Glycosyl hydrolase family 14
MRMLKIILAMWMATLGVLAAEPLSVRLGNTNEEHGLSVPSGGDGGNVAAEVGGSSCRRIEGEKAGYLYVKADVARVPRGDYDAYVSVEYFDDAPQFARVVYDATPEVREQNTYYTVADDTILLIGSGQWQRAVIHLPHARFGHGQNFQADFRLAGHGLAVRRIEVSFSKPDDYRPGGFDTVKLEALRAHIGAGMELDLGCDATPAQAALYRMLGFTCVESYVTWQTVEDAGEGKWDWSHWDRQVEILEHAGLKWAPLLVCGPAYSLPKWFRESDRSVPYVCLEHGGASKIQSLWDPKFRFWVDRFIKAFAQRYRDRGVVALVRLGVTGIYGETLYPSGPDSGWAFKIAGPYHNHGGWWAGDPLAVADFRRCMQRRYGTIAALNRAWGTEHAAFDAVAPMVPAKAPSRRARLDFVNWYVQCMTDYSGFWDATVRKHFPKTPIYQSLGGSGEPVLGADFSAQGKAAAPSRVRLRVTNEGSDYATNFAITREVVSAARAFGLGSGLEPASHVSAEGNVARIYNATASGAVHLFCYNGNIIQDQASLALFRRYLPFLQRRTPVVPAALFLPKTSWELDDSCIHRTLRVAQVLRGTADCDLLDRTTLATPLARRAKVMVVAEAPYAEPEEIEMLRRWVARGGILIARPSADGLLLRTPEGSDTPRDALVSIPTPGRQLMRSRLSGPPPRHFQLAIGDGDERFLWGDWHGVEPGRMVSQAPGAKMRWTRAKAGCYLPCDPHADATLVLTANLLPQSLPGPNRVLVNGTVVGTLDKTGSRVWRFPVAKELLAGRPIAQVALEIRTFLPRQGGDMRELGVAVSAFEIFSKGCEGEPLSAAHMTWEMDWSQAGSCVRHIGRGATLTMTSQGPSELGAVVAEVMVHPERLIPGAKGVSLPAAGVDGVFGTTLTDGVLYYNSKAEQARVDDVEVPAHGIAWKEIQ